VCSSDLPALFKRLSGVDGSNLWAADRASLFNYNGSNWLESAVPLGTGYFTSVYFDDPWNGWAVGGLLSAEGGPKRYIYKYVIEPYDLAADRIIYIAAATYEANLALYGNNIQESAVFSLEAAAGLALVTSEVRYDTSLKKNKIDLKVTVDPYACRAGTYGFTIDNPDEATGGSGTFTLRESAAPTERPVAVTVAEKVFDPATSDQLKLKVATPGQVTGSGLRGSSVPPDVELEMIVHRLSSREIPYRRRFFADPSGYTEITLQKVTDLGMDISDGIYSVMVRHPTYGKIGSGVIVVHHSR
jgi:hypothetical protein